MRRLMPARRLVPLFLAAVALLSAAACISKQKEAPAAEQETQIAPAPPDTTAGGFVRIRPDSNGARQAYEYLREILADEHPDLELGDLLEASSQVVAGIKFRLVCEYAAAGDRTRKKRLTALVFIDLYSNGSLLDLQLNEPPRE
jgi:hypothetical protein